MARLAKGLAQLRSQANTLATKRSKISDGWIGNVEHLSRKSDHNPDRDGVVHALDLTHDPANGLDINKVMAALVASADRRISYLIWNKRKWNLDISPSWRKYTGSNPHTRHGHISTKRHGRDDERSWHITDTSAPVTHPERSPSNPYASKPLLRHGSTNTREVRRLQKALNALGADPQLEVDGDFGPRTYDAVVAFQRDRDIDVDGRVGAYTWEQIDLAKKKPGRGLVTPRRPSAKLPTEQAGIETDLFIDRVGLRLFGGNIRSKKTKSTLEQIIEYWEKEYPNRDIRWLAYALGTAHHETDRTFGPIREYGRGRGKRYHPYYGRGLVQLTWKENYEKMGEEVGIPHLASKPDLALSVKHAIPIMFKGMEGGIFTGKKFSDYFNRKTEDWVQARKIINGRDKARLIADYAKDYLKALSN